MNITSTNPKVKAEIDKVENLIETLSSAVDEVKASETFKAWLEMTGKFYNYSYYNTLLIMIQNPEARRVAGFKQWKVKFDRQVQKGEKGMNIFCPMFKKIEVEYENETTGDTYTRKENRLTGFRLVKVFDVAQTEGKELPECPHEKMGGDDYASHYANLKALAIKMGIVVEEATMPNGIGGASSNGTITINTEFGLTDRAHTMAHEIAHEILHWTGDKASRGHNEMEAEAVAYAVSTSIGIDCQHHSATYLAAWKANNDGLKASMERIARTAKRIMQGLDDPKMIRELKIEREEAALAA